MTESKRPLKVFLCHAHSDKDSVTALYIRLTNDGVDIMPVGYAWLDKEKLIPLVPAPQVATKDEMLKTYPQLTAEAVEEALRYAAQSVKNEILLDIRVAN